ncbi:hypothetical protein J416_05808 [Gracilibacillus halophilus YIM-C55.5]|uniref:YqzL family protein n=1 Tax=Gracilibacillus halophilus YIM-C55.5 TaxID=1308866 RepID=N4WMY3_9BACI|nr:YqzL family protein [Gracilibacillus halophilus]ENH97502.1 hypothetical protein J416_05808 [Gracilibacillus halophilus YIM-C55.5]
MIDVPWKIFSQTGNIEAYLWMKEIEGEIEKDDTYEPDDTILEDTRS